MRGGRRLPRAQPQANAMQLRQKLFVVLSLMAMVPLLFLLFGVMSWVESELEERTSAELNQTLSKMTQEIDSLMDTQQSLVEGLSKVPVLRRFAEVSRDPEHAQYRTRADALAQFFRNYQATVPSIQAVRFSDPSGKTLVKVKEGHLIDLKHMDAGGRPYVEDIAYKPFFQQALAQPERITISDFERGQVAGEVDFCPAMVRYSAPIRDELDSLQGLLTVNMWGRRLDNVIEAALGGYPGSCYMVELSRSIERDGIYLYHEDTDKRFANQMDTPYRLQNEIGEDAWKEIKAGGEAGFIRAPDERMLFYRKYRPFPDRDSQWLVIVETTTATVLAPVASLRSWIAYLLVAMFVLSMFVARWAAARLARPVHELARVITRYANGDRHVHYHDSRRDEIGSAGRAFNYMSESLERARAERDKAEHAAQQSERLAAIGQMAAGIGHEINNPLMNINSLAELLEDGMTTESKQVREDLRALRGEVRRCARIVQGILNFARETAPRLERFDLAAMVASTIDLFRHRAESAHVLIETDMQQPLSLVGDANQLQQVLVNVLLNAVQASPPDSRILVRANGDDNVADIEVIDEGRGIAQESLDKVFNPFYTTKPEGAGTGLGLSVSYGIVRKHQGQISIENRPEGGVSVHIRLPHQHEPAMPEVRHAS